MNLPPFDESPLSSCRSLWLKMSSHSQKMLRGVGAVQSGHAGLLGAQKRQKTGPTSVLSVTDNFRVIGPREIRVLTERGYI